MAHRIRGFFKTALENLVSYRSTQLSRYAARPVDATRERNRHRIYYV